MNTRRKRNTTQDSREFLRSSLSESTEALRPSTKRQPKDNAWSTPKGSDAALNFDNIPDADFVDADELFGSLGSSLGLGNSFSMAPTPKQRPPPVPQFSSSSNPQPHATTTGLNLAWSGMGGRGAFDSNFTNLPPPVPQHNDLQEWGEEEDAVLREGVLRYGNSDWDAVSRHMLPSHCHRSAVSCEMRWGIVKNNMVKGPWLPEEDLLLRDLVAKIGAKKWSVIASSIPGRAGKQCRERWLNHLDSAVKKCDWSEEEDAQLIAAQRMLGNKWSDIAKMLPGRAENAVKNRYNSLITKRIAKRTANIAAKAEEEFQREATAEQDRVEMAQTLRGKNVLQQIFSVVTPAAPPDGPKLYMGQGLNLRMDQPDLGDDGVAIELDLRARDEDIPVEHLAMTKKYVEQEKARANLFNDVTFSSGEYRNIEALVRGQSNGPNQAAFFDQRGVTMRPNTCASPSRSRSNQVPFINKAMSPSGRGGKTSKSTTLKKNQHTDQGLVDEDEDLFDPMGAFKSLSIDQDAWDAVLGNSLETSGGQMGLARFSPRAGGGGGSKKQGTETNIGTRFSLSRNLGSPRTGGGAAVPPTLSHLGAFGGVNTSIPNLDFGLDGSLGSTLGGSMMMSNGGSLGGGGLGGTSNQRNTRASSSVQQDKKKDNGAEATNNDTNANSLESRMSGMSLDEEEWKGVAMREPGKARNNNSSGGPSNIYNNPAAFRLSPRDEWVFRASQQAAAEEAAAAVLNGTLGNSLTGGFGAGGVSSSHEMLGDGDFMTNGDSLSNWTIGGSSGSGGVVGRPFVASPTGSIDDEDWDLLCGMGTTPKHLSSSVNHMTRSSTDAGTTGSYSLRSSNGNFTSGQRSPAAVPRRSRAVKRVSPQRMNGASPPRSSGGGMTPRARALMAVNEDFKAGRIGKDEKQRIKEKILHGK